MSRVKHINEGFAHQNLRGRDFSGQDFLECDFRHSDLTDASLQNSNLYRSDFTGAKLAGATVSLGCFTFSHITLDKEQVDQILYLLSLAEISDEQLEGILRVITFRKKEKLDKLFGQK